MTYSPSAVHFIHTPLFDESADEALGLNGLRAAQAMIQANLVVGKFIGGTTSTVLESGESEMPKKSVEQRLLASAEQAFAIKRGELAPAQAYDLPLTARQAIAEKPPAYTKDAIARIRGSMKLSQALFAEALNVSLGTVRSWEQGIRVPDGAASRLLQVAERDPGALTSFLQPRDAAMDSKSGGVLPTKAHDVSKGDSSASMRPNVHGTSRVTKTRSHTVKRMHKASSRPRRR